VARALVARPVAAVDVLGLTVKRRRAVQRVQEAAGPVAATRDLAHAVGTAAWAVVKANAGQVRALAARRARVHVVLYIAFALDHVAARLSQFVPIADVHARA